MKIVVVSGTEYADIKTFFSDMKKDEGSKKLVFPEFERVEHQRILLNRIIKTVEECVEENRSIYILTYSSIVLNGVRFVSMEKDIKGIAYLLVADDEVIKASIYTNGTMSTWIPGIFDTEENEIFDRWLEDPKITLVTGMPNTDLPGFFEKMEKARNYVVLTFPEHGAIEHPYKLYKRMVSVIAYCVEEYDNVYIATFSEDIRSAVQTVCKEKNIQAKVVFLKEDNTTGTGLINRDGTSKDLPEGILDTQYESVMKII